MSQDNDRDDDKTRIAPRVGPASGDDRTRVSRQGDGPAAGRKAQPTASDDRTQIARSAAAAAPVKPVQPGVLINNNYRVQQMLSQGGMGEVYRAENVFTGDPVALKIVLPSLAEDDGIVQLFMREARILGQLADESIVRYHNFVLDQGLNRYCLIMEFIDGTTLWDHVDVHGRLAPNNALNLMRRLAEGLAKAHARNVTHRDLSPDNVMLRGDDINQPVLIDFGIARAADMGEGALAGRFAGKFKYIAPEQLGHFGGEIGPRADIYGMALMIAAVLRGAPLDMGSSAEEAAAARRTIPDLTGLPHEVYPLLQYMLEPDPAARPANMMDVAAMAADPIRIPLHYRHPLWGRHGEVTDDRGGTTGSGRRGGTSALIDDDSGSPFGAVTQTAVVAEPQPASRQRPAWVLLVAAVAAVGVLAVIGWLALRSEPPQPPPDDDGAQAGNQQPIVLPGRDVSTREGFLAGFELEPCTQVQRIVSGLDSGRLAALADGPRDYSALLTGYDRAFSARPAMVENRITPDQCAALSFVRRLQGRAEAAPVLSLDSDSLTSGGAIAGRVREARGRPVWLFLVAPDGGVHDLSSRQTAQADGSFTFSFGMARTDAIDQTTPQLIVALASQEPLVTPATAPAGAKATELLPRALREIADSGGLAAANIAYFQLLPSPPDMDEVEPPGAGGGADDVPATQPGD